MKSLLLILVLFLPVIFISCKQDKSAAKQIEELNKSDTFLIDNQKPKYIISGSEQDSLHIIRFNYYEKSLGLRSLKNGFDSIQLRIDYGCVMDETRIVSLINNNNQWKAEISYLRVSLNPNFNQESNRNYWEKYDYWRLVEYKDPISGWEKFIEKLFGLDVLKLSTYDRLPGIDTNYYAPTDGCGVGIEIATKNVYRRYNYDNPDDYADKYNEARRIISILKLLNYEFGIKDWPDHIERPERENDTIDRPIKIQEIELQEVLPEKKKPKKKY